jgi:hypothetical protein
MFKALSDLLNLSDVVTKLTGQAAGGFICFERCRCPDAREKASGSILIERCDREGDGQALVDSLSLSDLLSLLGGSPGGPGYVFKALTVEWEAKNQTIDWDGRAQTVDWDAREMTVTD